MSVATSTALALIGTGVAAGGTIYAAKKGADAAKDASKTEAESADKALQVLKEQYELERGDNAGYRAIGQGGLGNLAYLSGIDLDAEKAKANPDKTAAEAVRQSVEDQARAQMPGQVDTTLPGAPGPRGAPRMPTSLSAYGPTNPRGFFNKPVQELTQGGMVRVQSPSGQVGMIPSTQLQAAIRAGGRQVS